MDKERNEDLNPRSDDVEERVKQMLDPSIPDVPDLDSVPAVVPTEKPEKVVVIKPAPAQAKKSIKVSDAPATAPELPGTNNATADELPIPPSAKSSKKVIIPISHDADVKETVTDDTGPRSQLAKEKPPKPINKITITDHDESPQQVAEKLEEAIADLAPNDTDEQVALGTAPVVPILADTDMDAKLEELSTESDVPTMELPAETGADDEVIIEDPAIITDPQTDKAVADIVASESDEILEIEDAVKDADGPIEKPKKQRLGIGSSIKKLLRKPAVRWALVLVILVGGTATAAVPTSRYFVLNTAGVRVNSSLVVLDDSTSQPLKNVEVRLGASSGTTDDTGRVELSNVRLGSNDLTITKRAFAPYTKGVVTGFGSNPLGDFRLIPTGTQYTISVQDFLSGKAIEKVAASSGQADAVSDEKGIIKLTIDKPAETEFIISLKLDGYRSEELAINPDDMAAKAVKLVPAKKHVYVSKRSGKYDVYSSYIDGKDEKVILSGSGNERDDMVLVSHPQDNVVAYVSTRPGQRNSEGFVLSNVVIINLDETETDNVGSAEQIKIISWAGDRLVYVQIASGASAQKPDRYRLMSYNHKDGSSKELAKANFFNDVIGIGNDIYYAPSSAYQTDAAKLYKVNADGSSSETLHDKEVWNIFRTSYDHLALAVQQQWYDLSIGDKQPSKLNAAPANQVSRVYVNSPDGKHSLWVDSRDGKGVLLSYDIAAKTDKVLKTESGLGYPVRWLSNTVAVYRIKNNQETADYAISLDGGEAVKIHDVTNVAGLSRWL